MQDTRLGRQINGLHTCIHDLEAEMEDLKALDNKRLRKLAKQGKYKH